MNRLKRAFLKFVFFVLRRSIHYLFVIVYAGKKQVVPAVENPLLLKSATAAAAEIREGKVSSERLVRAYIDRIREVEPYINAVVDSRFEEAIEEARTADALVASGARSAEQLATEKPLLGVPFTVKLLLEVQGLRCTAGCKIFQDMKAHEDAVTVSLMKKAGAICVANTNAPEFGFNFETHNKVHGRTKNPYDTRRTCGGSSGGEAAIIAAAGSVVGIGNDLGGSCRFPAFNCCLFGHKPTAGLVSNEGTFPVPPPKIEPMVTAGPLCRYAEDLSTVMKVLVGDKAEEIKIDKMVDFKSVKVYYMLCEGGTILGPSLNPNLEESVKKVVRYFKDTYATSPQLVEFRGMSHSFELWLRKLLAGIDDDTFFKLTGGKVPIKPAKEFAKLLVGCSDFALNSVLVFNSHGLVDFISDKQLATKFQEGVDQLDEEFQRILGGDAVLFLPTFPTTASYLQEMEVLIPAVGNMAIFNVLGYPVTQCTLGLGSDGLPVGLQVVAGKNRDYLTLAVAREIEKAFGGWVPPGQRVPTPEHRIQSV